MNIVPTLRPTLNEPARDAIGEVSLTERPDSATPVAKP